MEIEEKSRSFYLKEFEYNDGISNVVFNIVDINTENNTIKLAITNLGKISVIEFDLLRDKENNLYFEYSCDYSKIYIEDFK